MSVKPILFSGSMVKALLEGRKTQTRRVIKLPKKTASGGPIYEHPKMGGWEPTTIGGDGVFTFDGTGNRQAVPEKVAIWHQTTGTVLITKHQPGDVLYVRETWCHVPDSHDGMGSCTYYRALPPEVYKPPYTENAPKHWDAQNAQWMKENGFRWKPSIHMPRWASRITLPVTNVRVERLQDITEEDARAEGVLATLTDPATGNVIETTPGNRDGFACLWDSLNAKRGYGWDANPWVSVTEWKEIHVQNVDEFLKERGE